MTTPLLVPSSGRTWTDLFRRGAALALQEEKDDEEQALSETPMPM